MIGMMACAPHGQDSGVGKVRLGLDTTRCSDFCIDIVQATLFRPSNPYSPAASPVITTCESAEAISFEFNAGTTLFAEVQMSSDGQTVLDGQSNEETVATDQDTQLDVLLIPAEGSGPVIDTIQPNPVVEGGQITINSATLPEQNGWWAVELDGVALASEEVSWSDDTVSVLLQNGEGGSSLRLRNCGLTSNELPLRVLRNDLDVQESAFPACTSLLDVDIHIHGDDSSAMALCSDSGAGNITRYDLEACSVGETVASFDSAQVSGPALLAAFVPDSTLSWVVFEGGGIQKIDLDNGGQVLISGTISSALMVEEMVCDAEGCFLLTRDEGDDLTVWQVAEEGGSLMVSSAEASIGITAEESPRGLLLSGDSLYVATYDASLMHAVLRKVGTSSTTEVLVPNCQTPLALNFSSVENWIALSCQNEDRARVFVLDLSGSDVRSSSWDLSTGFNAPIALEFDVAQDVLLVVASGSEGDNEVLALKIEAQSAELSLSLIQSWSLGEGGGIRALHRAAGVDRFIGLADEPRLLRFQPYLGTPACIETSVQTDP